MHAAARPTTVREGGVVRGARGRWALGCASRRWEGVAFLGTRHPFRKRASRGAIWPVMDDVFRPAPVCSQTCSTNL